VFHEKVQQIVITKFLGSTDLLSITFQVSNGSENFLLSIGFIGIKRRIILRRLQKYKHRIVKNATNGIPGLSNFEENARI
jgi:hypothetical protein